MPIPQPLNPGAMSGSMTQNPGLNASGPKMNFNKTPSQNLQGRMSFKPQPVNQNNFSKGSLGNSAPNIGSGQMNNYGAPPPYQSVKQMPMMGMLNNTPQQQVSPVFSNPALGISPSNGIGPSEPPVMRYAGGSPTFNEKGPFPQTGPMIPPQDNGGVMNPDGSLMNGNTGVAGTGVGGMQLPSFTQFQEPTGAPPMPPPGNPMTTTSGQVGGGLGTGSLTTRAPLGTGVSPSNNIWQKMMMGMAGR